MRYGVFSPVFCIIVAGVWHTPPAGAEKPVMEQFKTMYVKSKSTDRTAVIFKEAVEKKQCTICHLPKPQKGFNAYGKQVSTLITKCNSQDAQAVRAALKKVAQMKSNPSDSKSLTFGQRLAQGKLPVGEIIVRPPKDASASK